MAITVLLVDDAADLRLLLRTAMRLRGGFELAGEASDGAEALAAAAEGQPDVIVLDLGLPDLPGTDLIGRLRATAPASRIVVFTGTDVSAASLHGRVEGFVRKDEDVWKLLDLLADVAAAPTPSIEADLPADPASAAEARRLVRQALARWGCESVADEALVVVSELVTNGVVHAESGVRLRVARLPQHIRIDVEDEGEASPDPMIATSEDEHGRGLLLVSMMSSAWGVEPVARGKSVWAELPCPA